MAGPEGKYGQLIIISRMGSDGKAFLMHNEQVMIGRLETCDICMKRPQVSKEHCLIRVADDKVIARNLGDNGTQINSRILKLGEEHVLATGDLITIVGRSLRYERPRDTSVLLAPHQLAQIDVLPNRQPIQPAGGALVTATKLRPRLVRTKPRRTPEAERKFKRWDEHYSGLSRQASGSGQSGSVDSTRPDWRSLASSSSNLLAESPPSMLYRSCVSQTLDDDVDDVFGDRPGGDPPAASEAALNTPPSAKLAGEGASVVRDEVRRIMDEISQMAQAPAANPPLAPLGRQLSASRRRSRPLEAPLGRQLSASRRRSRPLEAQLPAPPDAAQDAHGRREETSPERKVRTPAQFFASLPRAPNAQKAQKGALIRQSSPLKRTLSCSSRPQPTQPILVPPQPTLDPGEESEEVPTEPEPETEEDEDEDEVVLSPESSKDPAPLLALQTPPPRQRRVLADGRPGPRKSVRFGPALSPEVYEENAPPSTPLRRGTPLQPARRTAGILRRGGSESAMQLTPHPAAGRAGLGFGELLQPRQTRRATMNRFLSTLSSLDEGYAPEEGCLAGLFGYESASEFPGRIGGMVAESLAKAKEEVDEPAGVLVPEPAGVLAPEPAAGLASDQAPQSARRRRSVRLARMDRRVTLDSMKLEPATLDADSPRLVVRTNASRLDYFSPVSTPPRPSRLRPAVCADESPASGVKRRARAERRRTAPVMMDFSASMAAMAAALGEDIPPMPVAAQAKKDDQKQEQQQQQQPGAEHDHNHELKIQHNAEEDISESPSSQLPLGGWPLGLADSMYLQLQMNSPVEPAHSAMPLPLMPSRVSSSELLLREQAVLQARIASHSAAPDASSNAAAGGVSSDVLNEAVTPAVRSRDRRQTTTDIEPLSADEDITQSTDDLLAHRQRLRRMQERKRRRQTIADIKKRRSSWLGWVPAQTPPRSPATLPPPATAQPPLLSPPQSRALASKSAGHAANQPTAAAAAFDFELEFAAKGGSDDAAPFSSPTTRKSTSTMYPPPAAKNTPEPRKKRRLTEYVASALGIGSPEPRALPAKNDDFAYPPRPEPIDANWEHVERKALNGIGNATPSPAAGEEPVSASQPVELFAVTQPSSIASSSPSIASNKRHPLRRNTAANNSSTSIASSRSASRGARNGGSTTAATTTTSRSSSISAIPSLRRGPSSAWTQHRQPPASQPANPPVQRSAAISARISLSANTRAKPVGGATSAVHASAINIASASSASDSNPSPSLRRNPNMKAHASSNIQSDHVGQRSTRDNNIQALQNPPRVSTIGTQKQRQSQLTTPVRRPASRNSIAPLVSPIITRSARKRKTAEGPAIPEITAPSLDSRTRTLASKAASAANAASNLASNASAVSVSALPAAAAKRAHRPSAATPTTCKPKLPPPPRPSKRTKRS